MNTDARIDDYIDKAKPFAKPILTLLRKLIHQASPHITETIKWGAPFFEYKGLIGGMVAFKEHCAFNFMKRQLMKDVAIFDGNNREAKGHLGKIISVADLPADNVMISYIREAMQLNEAGKQPEKKKPSSKESLVYPDDVKAALQQNTKASVAFENMSMTHHKEYLEWIGEAKTEATRSKRIATMITWLEEGKKRNWKYEKA